MRFLIGISTEGDFADDGDDNGKRAGWPVSEVKGGETGNADCGELTVKVAL